MRVGVISDIHSNVVAFKACLERMEQEGCEEYIFLGDYVSDTPYTAEVMQLLHSFLASHVCTVIRGNREEYIIAQRETIRSGAQDSIWIKNSASGNLLYTYERLTEQDIDFFENLPITCIYRREELPAITCAHGSPSNTRELLQHDSDVLKKTLEEIDTDYLLCAHTHFPGVTRYQGKTYINSGCVGVPIGTPGLAQCVILEGNSQGWQPEFLLVPYDNKKVARDCIEMGLKDYAPWFINSNIKILMSGFDDAARMVERAKQLQKQAIGDALEWPHIKEQYFASAAHELGIKDYGIGDLE